MFVVRPKLNECLFMMSNKKLKFKKKKLNESFSIVSAMDKKLNGNIYVYIVWMNELEPNVVFSINFCFFLSFISFGRQFIYLVRIITFTHLPTFPNCIFVIYLIETMLTIIFTMSFFVKHNYFLIILTLSA